MNINHKPAEMDFRDQIKDRSADICNPPTFPVLSGDDTRAQTFDFSAAETLLKEMRAIAAVAGQCSVEGPQDTRAFMAAAEAKRCADWADRWEALLSASPSAGEGSKGHGKQER